MFARKRLELCRQLPVLAHFVPVPGPASHERNRDNRRPLNNAFAQYLLASKRRWQQVDRRLHAALHANADNAAAPPNMAARLPAAHPIGASAAKLQTCT